MPALGLGLSIVSVSIARIYTDTNEIPEPATIWSFTTPPVGRTITGFSITTDSVGTILVDWGDGTSNTINSGSLVNRTYWV